MKYITLRLLTIYYSYVVLLFPITIPPTKTMYDGIVQPPELEFKTLTQKKPLPPTALMELPLVEPVLKPKAKTVVAVVSAKYGGSNTYTRFQCTWGVKNKRPDIPNTWGNASQWFARAQAMGWPTGSTPRVGAIGQRNNHVVYVLAVLPNGQIKIWEQNYDYNGSIRTKIDFASRYRYIY